MVWTILIVIIAIALLRFNSYLNNDNNDLHDITLSEKFNVVVKMINDAAFNGNGSLTVLNKKKFNLCKEGENQIIQFHYNTGHLIITWEYNSFQEEIIHKKKFYDVRNLSISEQQKIGEQMITEMTNVVEGHKNDVLDTI